MSSRSTSAFILRYVRAMANSSHASEIESLHHLMDGQIEALEFIVKDDIDGLTGVPLRDLHSRADVLVACIVHGDKIIIPTGNDTIERGDTVIIVTTGQLQSIKDILA